MNRFTSTFFSGNRQSAIQNRKWVALLTIVFAFTMCWARAEAQQSKDISRIGILSPDSISVRTDLYDAFRQGLRDLGYIERRNILFAWRSAELNLELLFERAR